MLAWSDQNASLTSEPGHGRSLFERALEALPDGVLLTDARRHVVYANQSFAKHWGIPADVIQSRDETLMLRLVADPLIDPDAFLREVDRVHPTCEESHDEIRFEDGRLFSRRSVPFEKDGAFDTRIWIFTDNTEAHDARIDPLTGLLNRRAYSSRFPEFVEAVGDGFVRSISILDVDHFKQYNDRYGHAAGDAVLRRLGTILRSHLQNADDLVFRIGGEEFLLGVRSRAESDALLLFEKIRRSIEGMGLIHAGNPSHGVVTASTGLVTFNKPQGPAYIFSRADSALYQAKAAGRNTVNRVRC
jgi:diguanylate cyclase (GGDEF)-like protein